VLLAKETGKNLLEFRDAVEQNWRLKIDAQSVYGPCPPSSGSLRRRPARLLRTSSCEWGKRGSAWLHSLAKETGKNLLEFRDAVEQNWRLKIDAQSVYGSHDDLVRSLARRAPDRSADVPPACSAHHHVSGGKGEVHVLALTSKSPTIRVAAEVHRLMADSFCGNGRWRRMSQPCPPSSGSLRRRPARLLRTSSCEWGKRGSAWPRKARRFESRQKCTA
jgi:hypothetical protein